MKLRPYQNESIAAIRKAFIGGTNRQLLSMATGVGKTCIFSNLPEMLKDLLPGKTLVLAHRDELIGQAIDKLQKSNPSLRIDREEAEHVADPSKADIVVASVATLGRKGTKRLDKFDWSQFDLIVTDEAHHSTAQSYINIYEASGILEGNNRLLLGCTATPVRSDGKALAQIYQKIVYSYPMRQAIEEGWLVEPCGVKVNTHNSLDSVKTTAGDYAIGQLANVVNTPERNQLIVKAWLDNASDRPTVAFTADIAHAKDLAEMFRHYGVKAEAIWGDDPKRAEKLAQHRAGEITILCNCGVLTEGYDDWRISCIILGRPTKSSVLFTQMVGRGTRLEEGCENLLTAVGNWKRDCIVIDVVDVSSRHSLITLPTLMGMSSTLDLRGKGVVTVVKALEEAQKQYPHVDFSKLSAIDNLSAFVENVNLFDIKFTSDVEANSELSWHTAATGGYVLLLPERDQVKISQNLLDKWEISGTIKGKRYKGERETMAEAFSAADTVIQQNCSEALKVLRREESWHSQPVTTGQMKLLAKFYRGKALPLDLNKGKASRLISSFLAGKA